MAVELKDLRINNENESRKKKFKESLVGDMSVDWINCERQERFEIFWENVEQIPGVYPTKTPVLQ